MRSLRFRAVMAFARLFRVPIAVHQAFFAKGMKSKL